MLIVLFIYQLLTVVATTKPAITYESSGAVTSFVADNNSIYAATSVGKVDVFNKNASKVQWSIDIPTILNSRSETVLPHIYSIDKTGNILVLTTQGSKNYSDIYLYDLTAKKLTKALDAATYKMSVRKTIFIDASRLLMATAGDELILFDLRTNTKTYQVQVNSYTFSDFAPDEQRKQVVLSDESGILFIVETATGKTVRSIKTSHFDNVYKVDYKSGKIASGSRDRKVVIQTDAGASKTSYDNDFLVFCVGLSTNADKVAYSATEDNTVTVRDVQTGSILQQLQQHNGIITQITFLSDNELLTSGEDKKICLWKL